MSQPPSSNRLPTFRDYNDIQKNISKILNKKNYVPNLSLSRNVPPKVKVEDGVPDVPKKEEPTTSKDKRKPKRFEKNLVVADPTFAPASDCTRNRLILSKSKIKVGGSSGIKKENIDRLASTDISGKQFTSKFEELSTASPTDLPVSIPHVRSSSLNENKKSLSLLTDILKPDNDGSSLILLKTPKYLPAVLDKSENPKIDFKNNTEKAGYKCTMHDLPEGQIGKLQIMKSGRIGLVLGECKFWLHQGIEVNFKEELAVVKTDPESKTGEIINLGDVRGRVTVVPDNVTKFGVDF